MKLHRLLMFVSLMLLFINFGCAENSQISQNKKDSELFLAIKKGNAERVKELLESGANANCLRQLPSLDSNGEVELHSNGEVAMTDVYETPLAVAITNRNTKIAQLLLDNGANVDKYAVRLDTSRKESLVSSTFPQSVNKQDVEMMKLLISYKANLNRDDTTYPVIVEAETVDVLNLLIKNEFDINTQNIETGDTALIRAVVTNNLKLVRTILSYKPDLNLKLKPVNSGFDYQQLTALGAAKHMKYKGIIKELKKAGAKK
jgi:uncharacterized protein